MSRGIVLCGLDLRPIRLDRGIHILILVGNIYWLAHCLLLHHWSDEDGVGNELDVTLSSLWLHHGHLRLLHAQLVRGNVDGILSELETVSLSLLDEGRLVNLRLATLQKVRILKFLGLNFKTHGILDSSL